MTQNGKTGWGGNPIRPEIEKRSHDTKSISSNPKVFKGFSRPAAVYEHSDPRGMSLARVVPPTARPLTVGGLILGYHQGNPDSSHAGWKFIVARQRFRELERLATYRRQHGLDDGPATGWAMVLANLARSLNLPRDITGVKDLCRRLRLAEIDEDISAAACGAADGDLMRSAYVGALIEVTAAERADCRLLRIDAWDEPSHDRKRRLARERQRRRRVTRTIDKRICERDNRRRTASPALRALRSSTLFRLPSRLDPHLPSKSL